MQYSKGKHCVYYYRYHLVWSTKYRYKVQREFPHLKKRYWGRRFWGRGYFSTTNGAITEDIVLQYLETHIEHPADACW